jgi:hippurate hydrolase
MNEIEEALEGQDELIAIRREIHANPETAFQEQDTSALVARKLTEWGLEVHTGIGKTGVVGVLRSGSSGKTIGLRADMDALPLTELNLFSHRSKRIGSMHACGHDGHTAMLLGAARYMAKHRDFDGTVVFVFQPAEEGGNAGARAMIRDGLFKRFPCDIIYGMHNWPGLPAGKFAIRPGPLMAATALWDIHLTGTGGHAAMPNRAVDSIVIAAELVQTLQSVVSRKRDPMSPAILSITQIHAGDAYNVLPEKLRLCGTVRTFEASTMDQIEGDMRTLVEGLPKLHGATGQLDFRRGYPSVTNDPQAAALAADVVLSHFGEASLESDLTPTLGGEDFSFYLQEIPGAFIFLGNGNSKNAQHDGTHSLHSPFYDFNDSLLPVGVRFWSRLVTTYLK